MFYLFMYFNAFLSVFFIFTLGLLFSLMFVLYDILTAFITVHFIVVRFYYNYCTPVSFYNFI